MYGYISSVRNHLPLLFPTFVLHRPNLHISGHRARKRILHAIIEESKERGSYEHQGREEGPPRRPGGRPD